MAVHEFTIKEVELINFRKRRYVRAMTTKAIRKGELIRPCHCELCNNRNQIEAHHIDYGRPLFVSWLCPSCHRKAHKPGHPLNPDNNPQSPMPYLLDQYKKVSISFEIPIRNYLALKEASEKTGRSITDLMSEQTENAFPVRDPQLKFNFEVKDDESQNVANSRVQSIQEDEGLREQPKRPILQEVRRERNYNLQGMEQQFLDIPFRHGTNAGRLQRNLAAR